MSEKSERKIESKEIYKGRVISLYNDTVECPNGNFAQREYVKHPGGVCILAMIEDKVILEHQYRYVYAKDILELPAGKLNKGENPKEAAIRELEEETGYVANTLIDLGKIYPSVGYTDEVIHLFFTNNLTKSKIHLDDDEFIDVELISYDKLLSMIEKSEIKDAKTIIAMLKYNEFIKRYQK